MHFLDNILAQDWPTMSLVESWIAEVVGCLLVESLVKD